MPDWLIVLILGIVEGITEFLPVSSTGHLLLFEHWLRVEKSDLFNIVIQCGAVIAVIPLFSHRIRDLLTKWREPRTRDYLAKLVTAFVITAVLGLIVDKMGFKLPDNPIPIGIAMLVGGILFLVIERFLGDRKGSEEITWAVAVAVGLGQILAGVFPGSSRSGTTILFSLLLGLSRPAATEFSFLVGIPTMLAAGGWKILKQLRHHEGAGENWGML
ncbi:MAG: Undecaprenyl-diphosphatase, partial [Verrucomicrobiales bacterium]|nr:Undecaprenyl-diphosphatase [Verrucomicrobiales bacterium]